MKEFKVKQDMLFVIVPLLFNLVVFISALLMESIWKWILIALSIGFAGLVLWQSRPLFKNFQLISHQRKSKF
jgi:protein-S-isoprenylcysteine O-methyltransferase Ste14